MKKIPFILLLAVFSFLHGSSFGQSDTSARAFHFTDSLFNRPEFTYDIAEPDISKDIQSILARFSDAVTANKEWFIDYRNKYAASGQSLPYNERFGITPGEYVRIQQLERVPPRMITISQKKVTISRENNVIHFKGDGEALIFNYLEIDLQQQKIMFAGDTLPFAGAMNAVQLSPFHLIQGYMWRLERADLKSTLQDNKITARVVELDLGLPAETGKTFLRIKYQDMQSGVTRADMDLTGFVH
ncbi:MAG TPA: hypothetical protein VGN00_18535 [Puia sp.]|jgi:hypothetical protein